MVNGDALKSVEDNLRLLDERARGLADTLTHFRTLQRERMSKRLPSTNVPVLTDREVAILRLIAAGKDNAEIAGELHFALGTIKLHVREILEALDAPTRAAAAVRAVRLGLI